MRKILIALVATVALSSTLPISSVMAQFIDEAQVEQMVNRLQLTDAQAASARLIIQAGILERAAILKSAGFQQGKKPTRRQLLKIRTPINESRARTESQLSTILNPQQMTEYRAITEEARQELRARFN